MRDILVPQRIPGTYRGHLQPIHDSQNEVKFDSTGTNSKRPEQAFRRVMLH